MAWVLALVKGASWVLVRWPISLACGEGRQRGRQSTPFLTNAALRWRPCIGLAFEEW